MSYDLMVFNPEIAPKKRHEFMAWYQEQTKWEEEHSYDDPIVTTANLRSWFMEMIKTFPAMNGPFAIDDPDDDSVTDYSVGRDVIYAAFAWSLAEEAYEVMKGLAEKHKVGFFDASADEGDILFPGENGKNESIENPENLSSIQQIKNSASPGQGDKTVQEIIYSKVLPRIAEQSNTSNQAVPEKKQSWWKKIFGLK